MSAASCGGGPLLAGDMEVEIEGALQTSESIQADKSHPQPLGADTGCAAPRRLRAPPRQTIEQASAAPIVGLHECGAH